MRNLIFIVFHIVCGACITSSAEFDDDVEFGQRNGVRCAGCTIVVGVLEQLSQVHNESIAQSMTRLCEMLPVKAYRVACDEIVVIFAPIVIEVLYAAGTPDVVCQLLFFCPRSSQCHLFPLPGGGLEAEVSKHKHLINKYLSKYEANLQFDVCRIPGIKYICDLLKKSFDFHEPLLDFDKDQFSPADVARGSSWRGRDCNDYNFDTHPGRRPVNADRELDSNCNGISGVDIDGVPYEDVLCSQSQPQGFIIIGDSVGAHFHVPEEWVWAEKLNEETAKYMPFVLDHEADWPMTSAATGFENLTLPVIHGPTSSVYLKLRQRNRCNHRDFQNLSVNGARSGNNDRAVRSLSRNFTTDYPVLVTYALFGNDVCKSTPNISDMTSPEQMRRNALKTFTHLNSVLPAGSHLLLIGLADGTVLFDALHNRFHPIGRINRDVTYPNFYDYLNCLKTSPCAGWLNTNETVRKATTQRANELSDVLKDLADKYRHFFSNFDINYVPCPLTAVIEEFKKKYGPDSAWQVLESVDGFHPNQFGEALAADYLFAYLEHNLPHVLGPININNARIMQLFGEQGGH